MESLYLHVTFGEDFMTIFERQKQLEKWCFPNTFQQKKFLFDNFQLKVEIISVIQCSNWYDIMKGCSVLFNSWVI